MVSSEYGPDCEVDDLKALSNLNGSEVYESRNV